MLSWDSVRNEAIPRRGLFTLSLHHCEPLSFIIYPISGIASIARVNRLIQVCSLYRGRMISGLDKQNDVSKVRVLKHSVLFHFLNVLLNISDCP